MRRGIHAGLPQQDGVGIAPLSAGDVDQIHLASLEVLERTGVWVQDDDALDVFADGGCRVDRETRMVQIPPHVIEEAAASTPATFTMYGRDPGNTVVFGGDRIHFMNFGEAVRVNDLGTGENRDSTKADVALAAKLVDWADQIDVWLTGLVPRDVTAELPTLHAVDAALTNLTKPILCGPASKPEFQSVFDLAAAVAGGTDELREKPLIAAGSCTVSPLQLCREGTDNWLGSARAGIPTMIMAMAMAGGSGPQTLAGTLVMDNAEVLAAVAMTQLAGKGTPVLFASSTLAMDLRFGGAALGTPEATLLNAAFAQMAQRYQIPCWVQGL